MQKKSNESVAKMYAVGMGPGDPRYLTRYAVEVFEEVDIIFYIETPKGKTSISLTILDSLPGLTHKYQKLHFSMAKDMDKREEAWNIAATKVIDCLLKNQKVAVATIGDPLIYSTFGYLRREILKHLPNLDIQVVPGITSFQVAAAKRGIPLVENSEVLTIIPAWKKDITCHRALDSADTAVFLKTYHTRDEVLSSIKQNMATDNVLYASRLGLPEEQISHSIEKIQELPIEYLSLVIAKRRTND